MEEERILGEYEIYRAQVEAINRNLESINASIIELGIVRESLDCIKSLSKENEVLVPIGADSFVEAKITDTKRVIVGLGANIAAKKSVEDAKVDLEKRIRQLEETRNKSTDGLQKLLAKIEELTPKVEQIISRMQKEG
jgi:prefoldin alpha subunit